MLSPDHKRVAVPIKRAAGAEIVIWNLDDGKSATFAVPLDICPLYCEPAWTSATDVVAAAHGTPPPSSIERLHIDAESGRTALVGIEAPHFAARGFQLVGELQLSRPDAGTSALVVVTPSGARVAVPNVETYWGLHYEAFGDRLLIWRDNMVTVIAKDSVLSELVMRSTPPAR